MSIKKLAIPTAPLPNQYMASEVEPVPNSLNLENVELNQKIANKTLLDVPRAKYGSQNLKKYKSFHNNRSGVKVHNQEVLAMQRLQWVKSVDVELNMMNLELITDIASFAESFFVYGNSKIRKESIARCTLETILPYCKNDVEVAQALLLSVDHKIIKSTKLSRRLTRLRNFLYMATEIVSRIFVRA